MKKKSSLIDTNIILRFFIGDINFQFIKAKKIFKEIEEKKAVGVISILVINELVWLLANFYHKKREEFIPKILEFMSCKNIKIMEIKKSDLVNILQLMLKSKLDFTDLYLYYFGKKLNHQITSFDKKLLKFHTSGV